MALILPDRRLERPASFRPVQPNWLAQINKAKAPSGLKFYWDASQGYQDLVSGQLADVLTNVSSTIDGHGKSVIASTTKLVFSNVVHDIGTGAFTLFCLYKWDGTAANFQTSISLPTCSEVGIYSPRNSTGELGSDTTVDSTMTFPDLVMSANTLYPLAFSCTASGNGTQIMRLGRLSQTKLDIHGYSEGGTKGVALLTGQGSEYAKGNIYAAGVMNRVISEAEWLKWVANPYHFLVPK